MKAHRMSKLLALVQRLEAAEIPFQMHRHRGDAISIEAYAPGEHWEIDFLDDGSVDVERFRSDGSIGDESTLGQLFELCADDSEVTAKHNGSTARS